MRNPATLLKLGAAATLVLISLLIPAKAQSIEWCTGGPV